MPSPIRVLLVEDNPGDADLTRETLETGKLHIELSLAKDGVEAIELLRRNSLPGGVRPDLILLDLNLPRKDGREILAEIKADPDLRSIPVLVLSTSAAHADIQ